MTERVFQVIPKEERHSITVTITSDRTSVKIPVQYDEMLRDKIVAFVRTIEDEVRTKCGKSMRGMFSQDLTELVFQNNSRSETLTFPFQEQVIHE